MSAYLDEYGDPTEETINDWNIHNDHQDDNDEYEDEREHDSCFDDYTEIEEREDSYLDASYEDRFEMDF